VEELGIEPGIELQQLERAIPSLIGRDADIERVRAL
jgi:hypothetical protein